MARTNSFILMAVIFAMQILSAAPGFSQDNEKKLISLSYTNTSIEKIFSAIEKKAGVIIMYEKTAAIKNEKVNISVTNKPVAEVMDILLKDLSMRWSIRGKFIRIENTENLTTAFKPMVASSYAEDTSVTVTGRVLSGRDGAALPGATVRIGTTDQMTRTDGNGSFKVRMPSRSFLNITYVGFYPREVRLPEAYNGGLFTVHLEEQPTALDRVEIVSSGYQQISKERATGSFTHIGEEMINRRVSTDILSRLNGIAGGLYFLPGEESGIRVRGESTLHSSINRKPLIVLDNFPYEGNISNINPNDVESITILKDAAAASIWGAQSGNGVIVITTKKGKLNQPLKMELNANLTIGNKPDLFYIRNVMSASDYIDVEQLLFNENFFDADISNTANRPVLTPVIDILAKQREGLISAAEAEAQINAFRKLDVRNDFSKYTLRKSVNQQYSIGLRGGGNKIAYAFSAGYDHNLKSAVRTSDQRFTINSSAAYTPVKNLEITTSLNYANTYASNNNPAAYGLVYTAYFGYSDKYSSLFPYAQLADDKGNALPTTRDYRAAYLDSVEALGFRDWRYRALDEIRLADRTSEINNLLLNVAVKYRIAPFLHASLQYQNERQIITDREVRDQQSYAMRNLFNMFTQYDPVTQKFTYNAPNGGILILNNSVLHSGDLRGQLSFNHTVQNDHEITAIAGAEVKELRNSGMRNVLAGYNKDNGIVNMNLNFNTVYPTTPAGSSTLGYTDLAPDGMERKSIYRYISYYANAAYTYKKRYTFTISGRKDGANIFGVRTNQKVTPLWSAGLGWDISRETFYHSGWFPYLKLRSSYGFNGNVYNGSAYSTGIYHTSSLTGETTIQNIIPGNPELKWERIRIVNMSIDFKTTRDILSGTLEVYRKEGLDLLQTVTRPPQTGSGSILQNSASSRTHGIELSVNSNNINREFKWQTGFIMNYIKDKVTSYNVPANSSSMQYYPSGIALEGKPLYSLFSYKWAGLDPVNGDPQGILNGRTSKDYTGIIANYDPDSLVYKGPTRPVLWGAVRNDLSFKGFSVSVNIVYEGGHYFRRRSTGLNYSELLLSTLNQNVDYANRWQKPGDELVTNVPSMSYPSNSNRNIFYQYSEMLVEKGDHIRLKDIRVGYDFTGLKKHGLPFERLQLYGYANNIGILWRENDHGIDPYNYDYNSIPAPFTVSFGVKANF
ncbi:SusC/RagA family TonB-linked outer membrane protein [Chitinophaga niabensis]|nr:SusC/RagA family TonB-linked outer membrane protein [Chitinophaga niabensis]